MSLKIGPQINSNQIQPPPPQTKIPAPNNGKKKPKSKRYDFQSDSDEWDSGSAFVGLSDGAIPHPKKMVPSAPTPML